MISEYTPRIISKSYIIKKNNSRVREQLRDKFENEINELQQVWQKRKNKNQSKLEKIKKGHKNIKLVTDFKLEQIDSYKKRVFDF